MTTPVRALIVDDEPLARDGLRMMLGGMADVRRGRRGRRRRRGGEGHRARCGRMSSCSTCRCRGQSGFDVVERAGRDHLPLVVFVTAYDEHALRAFQVHAFDYLLKPVSQARLAEAMARVRADMMRGAPPRERVARRRRHRPPRRERADVGRGRIHRAIRGARSRSLRAGAGRRRSTRIDAAANYVQAATRAAAASCCG